MRSKKPLLQDEWPQPPQGAVGEIVALMERAEITAIRRAAPGVVEVTRIVQGGDELSAGSQRRPVRDARQATLSLSKAAERLGIDAARTLRRAIRAHQIATVPWGSKRRRIPLSEVERLEREGFGGRRRENRTRVRPLLARQTDAEFHAEVERIRREPIQKMLDRHAAIRRGSRPR